MKHMFVYIHLNTKNIFNTKLMKMKNEKFSFLNIVMYVFLTITSARVCPEQKCISKEQICNTIFWSCFDYFGKHFNCIICSWSFNFKCVFIFPSSDISLLFNLCCDLCWNSFFCFGTNSRSIFKRSYFFFSSFVSTLIFVIFGYPKYLLLLFNFVWYMTLDPCWYFTIFLVCLFSYWYIYIHIVDSIVYSSHARHVFTRFDCSCVVRWVHSIGQEW